MSAQERRLRYTHASGDGPPVFLAVPWPPASGRIPPAFVTFVQDGHPQRYIYDGEEGDR